MICKPKSFSWTQKNRPNFWLLINLTSYHVLHLNLISRKPLFALENLAILKQRLVQDNHQNSPKKKPSSPFSSFFLGRQCQHYPPPQIACSATSRPLPSHHTPHPTPPAMASPPTPKHTPFLLSSQNSKTLPSSYLIFYFYDCFSYDLS